MSLVERDEENIIFCFRKNKTKYSPLTASEYEHFFNSMIRTYMRFFLAYCKYMGLGRRDIRALFRSYNGDLEVLLKRGMDFEQIPEESEMEIQWRS